MAAAGQVAGEPRVAVQQAANGVGDRLVGIVAFDQHGEERRDAPGGAPSGPLDQLGQQGEDRRRIAARGRRLARGQADLALGHGIARDRVHQQQDVLALVAKILGDRRGGGRRLHADQGRLVAGGHDHHALGQSLRARGRAR